MQASSSRRAGFTLVELLVVISIIAILAVLGVASFLNARISSRDARRKGDVGVLSAAVQSYAVARGTGFIKDNAGLAVGAADNTGFAMSYGRVNLKGVSDGGRTYPGSSTIAEALKSGGFIANEVKDPSAKGGNVQGDKDYILLRCDNTASQYYGPTESFFAVWTKLERTPSIVDTANSANYCGGSLSGAPAAFRTGSTQQPGLTPGTAGAQVTSSTAEIVSKYFAAGNGRRTNTAPVAAVAATPVPGAFDIASFSVTSAQPASYGAAVTLKVTPYDPANSPTHGQPISYVFTCDTGNASSPVFNGASTTIAAVSNSGCTYQLFTPLGITKDVTAKVVATQGSSTAQKTVVLKAKTYPLVIIGGMP